MINDKFKEQFAKSTAEAFRSIYKEVYDKISDEQVFNEDFIYNNLEKPKDSKMGRFAFPVFKYTKLLNDKPPKIAQIISDEANRLLETDKEEFRLLECEAAGGFINARVDFLTLVRDTIPKIMTEKSEYGSTDFGQNRKFLIEYSSVNVAKPFSVGHLRTTIIGNSLRRIFKKIGFDVVGINYLGDWGTQFGKMIVAYKKWGNPNLLNENIIANLHELYIRFHQEAEQNPKLDEEARQAFMQLETESKDSKNNESVKEKDINEINSKALNALFLWNIFSKRSIEEFKRVYNLMGIEFDLWLGESDMNEEMEKVIERLEKNGLTSVSEGALIVDLKDPLLPPCLLKKADGATLYATRDIAGMVYRWEKYHFYESLYVVGTAQSDHFKQVYKVIDMLEEAENLPSEDRMTGKVKHIDFGWIKFGDKAMSTRKGHVIYLEDVINKAVSMVREIIAEKNPVLENVDRTAHDIGVGAVIFSQFSVRRQKDVNFDWDTVLNFDGETGPYLQYTHARLCSLIQKYENEFSTDIDYTLLNGEEEKRIIELLYDFPSVIEQASLNYEPFFIASYLLRLAGAFNTFYQRKDTDGRIDKIISDNEKLTEARLALVTSVQVILKEGLYLLGIEAPEAM